MKTIYVKVKDLSTYLRDNNLNILASTGPNPNIAGMRKQYWGNDCTIIKSGNIAYKVS